MVSRYSTGSRTASYPRSTMSTIQGNGSFWAPRCGQIRKKMNIRCEGLLEYIDYTMPAEGLLS